MTTSTMNAAQPKPARLFTFASGGWVVLLTALLTLALITWAVAPAMMRSVYHPPGDGKDISTYQFDLANLRIPRDEILPIMIHRDMVPVMFNPTASGPTPGDESDSRWKPMQKHNDPKYGKYLVGDDRVVGVEINGESRCYPISVLTVHEIINDTLGNPPAPIAVTYHWPCDSVMVFDRRVNGQTLEFAVSGLIYNSNMLMYNAQHKVRDADGHPVIGGESLFSQMLAEGVSGPFSGEPLSIIPCTLTTWREWSAQHSQTTVLDRDLSMAKRYKDAAPTLYFRDDRPFRPVKPRSLPENASSPPSVSLPDKSRVIVLQPNIDQDIRHVLPISMLDSLADKDGLWITTIDGAKWQFHLDRNTQNVTAQGDPPWQGKVVAYSFWYAWHAMRPEDAVISR